MIYIKRKVLVKPKYNLVLGSLTEQIWPVIIMIKMTKQGGSENNANAVLKKGNITNIALKKINTNL